MSSSLCKLSVSGIYTCKCGNLETHIKGKSKAPCSSCNENSFWTEIISTEELEKVLNNKITSFNLETIKKRFEEKE